MTEQQENNPEPEGGGEGQSPETSEAERNFWKRMDERLDAAIARGVSKHVPKRQTGTQRTDGRTTLPSLIATLMGGPFAPEKDKK